jgi:CheY-like chemotaxis protein
MSETVLVLCDDLLFWSRIQGAARAAGVPVARAAGDRAIPESVRRVLVDLQASSLDPYAWAARWKAAGHAPELVAFGSHVDLEAQARAREAGFDRVLSRSAFVHELTALLTRPREDPGPPASSPS